MFIVQDSCYRFVKFYGFKPIKFDAKLILDGRM